jgi:hypothetical protein
MERKERKEMGDQEGKGRGQSERGKWRSRMNGESRKDKKRAEKQCDRQVTGRTSM